MCNIWIFLVPYASYDSEEIQIEIIRSLYSYDDFIIADFKKHTEEQAWLRNIKKGG
jgi:hypothetical protein